MLLCLSFDKIWFTIRQTELVWPVFVLPIVNHEKTTNESSRQFTYQIMFIFLNKKKLLKLFLLVAMSTWTEGLCFFFMKTFSYLYGNFAAVVLPISFINIAGLVDFNNVSGFSKVTRCASFVGFFNYRMQHPKSNPCVKSWQWLCL